MKSSLFDEYAEQYGLRIEAQDDSRATMVKGDDTWRFLSARSWLSPNSTLSIAERRAEALEPSLTELAEDAPTPPTKCALLVGVMEQPLGYEEPSEIAAGIHEVARTEDFEIDRVVFAYPKEDQGLVAVDFD